MYLAAKVNTMLYDTTTIHISEGKAEVGLTITDKYHHALGAMHGSVYFKLLDDACFFAVNSQVEDVFVLTTGFEVNLKRPVSSGIITAWGSVVEAGTDKYQAQAILKDQNGKIIATGKGIFVRSKTRLAEIAEYK